MTQKHRLIVSNGRVAEMCRELEDRYGSFQFTKTPYGNTPTTIVEFEYPGDPKDMVWLYKQYDLTDLAERNG